MNYVTDGTDVDMSSCSRSSSCSCDQSASEAEDDFLETNKPFLTFIFKRRIEMKECGSLYCGLKKFSYANHVPLTHKFYSKKADFEPKYEEDFQRALERDVDLLRRCVPDGILVKGFEGRVDLYSALIFGPADSPYEGGVFAFDIKLPEDYPLNPPEFRSFSCQTTEKIGGAGRRSGTGVRDFLFQTWQAKHLWTIESSLLDILVSIQNVIAKPYKVLSSTMENALVNPNIELTSSVSKRFNESVVLFFLAVLAEFLEQSPFPWKIELAYLKRAEIPGLIARYRRWLDASSAIACEKTEENLFPLLPFTQPWEVQKLIKRLKLILM